MKKYKLEVKISNKFKWYAKFLPCFLLHDYQFEDDNACFGFRCTKCKKYILLRDLTKDAHYD
jgi:hypothetical protein